MFVGVVVAVIGAFCAGLGYSRWQRRYQRYQDEMFMLQRDRALLEIEHQRVDLWRKQRDLL